MRLRTDRGKRAKKKQFNPADTGGGKTCKKDLSNE